MSWALLVLKANRVQRVRQEQPERKVGRPISRGWAAWVFWQLGYLTRSIFVHTVMFPFSIPYHIKTERDPVRPCNFHTFLIWGLSGTQVSFQFLVQYLLPITSYKKSRKPKILEENKKQKTREGNLGAQYASLFFGSVLFRQSILTLLSSSYCKVSAQCKNKPRLIRYYIFRR